MILKNKHNYKRYYPDILKTFFDADNIYYKCIDCEIIVFKEGENNKEYHISGLNGLWRDIIDLNCEEIIIKNIIE